MKKIIFFDIDGTIYDYRTGIEPSTRLAIAKLLENGHIPVLCTGRAKAMIHREIFELGFEGLVGACGTFVEYKNQCILNHILTESELETVQRAALRYQVRAVFEGPEALYYLEELKLLEYQERTGSLMEKYSRVEHLRKDSQVNKLTVHFHSSSELESFFSETEQILKPILHREADGYQYAECVPLGFTKAVGIEKMLQALNIDKTCSYAFGDSVNDLEMLNYVEYGIAMGNSSGEVKRAAKYHTAGMYEDGIYLGLKNFSLLS